MQGCQTMVFLFLKFYFCKKKGRYYKLLIENSNEKIERCDNNSNTTVLKPKHRNKTKIQDH